MLRRILHPPTDDAPEDGQPDDAARRQNEPDLASLPIAGITRRRLATVLGVALAAWIVIVFARQVSEAAAATTRAEAMIAANDAKREEIARLEGELEIGRASCRERVL